MSELKLVTGDGLRVTGCKLQGSRGSCVSECPHSHRIVRRSEGRGLRSRYSFETRITRLPRADFRFNRFAAIWHESSSI